MNMRGLNWILAAAGLIAVASVFFGSTVAAGPRSRGDVIPGRYIVVSVEGAAPAAVAADHGLARIHTYQYALNGFAAVIPQQALDALTRDPRVAFVEPDRAYTVADQELPTGIDRIETDKNLTAITVANVSVTIDMDVAIIDTGINQHDDLNLAGGINFAGGSTTKFKDGYGHGTHVAGTVAALDNGIGVVGVAPGAPVWAVRVCNNGGICLTSYMIAGIDWVAGRKAEYEADPNTGINFAAANMSLGTSNNATPCDQASNDALRNAVCGLVASGVPLALAAGNESTTKVAYDAAIAVSAIADFDGKGGGAASATCRNDKDDTLANFSNFGSTIDIAAPGVCILSTSSSGGLALGSGTSMAAPHVAGAVALYLHANDLAPATDRAGADLIRDAIIAAALPEGVTETNPCSYNNERGSNEPLLFVNDGIDFVGDPVSFGGDDSCDVATTTPPPEDTTGPTVTSVDPANGDIDVAITTNVTVTFSEPVDGTTVTSTTFTVNDGSANIAGAITMAGNGLSATFDPESDLANEATYTVTVTSGVTDTSGNALDQDGDPSNGNDDLTSSFTTAAAPAPGGAAAVNACSPDNASPGDQLIVAVTGSNFQDGATADFGERVMVQAVTFVSSSQLDIKIKVHPRAGSGVRDVTVSNPDGQSGTNTGCFTVN